MSAFMDGFRFDLQLFAEIRIALPEETGKVWYRIVKPGLDHDPNPAWLDDYIWTDTVSGVDAAAVTAKYYGKAEPPTLEVKISNGDEVVVNYIYGVLISVAANFIFDEGVGAFKAVGVAGGVSGTVRSDTAGLDSTVKSGTSAENNTGAYTAMFIAANDALVVSEGSKVDAMTAGTDGATFKCTTNYRASLVAGTVTVDANRDFFIDCKLYTNASTTDTATTITKEDGEIAVLKSGTVKIAEDDASLVARGFEVTKMGGTEYEPLTVNATGETFVTIAAGGKAKIGAVEYDNTGRDSEAVVSAKTIAAGGWAEINGVTYTNPSTTDTATLLVASGIQAMPVLVSGAVTFSAEGASIVAKGVTVTNEDAAALLVDATGDSAAVTIGTSGNAVVTIEAGKSATIDGETYDNTQDPSPLTITAVTVAVGGYVTDDGVTYRNTSDTAAAMLLVAGKPPVLTEGEVSFDKNASLVANGVTVTNTADATLAVSATGMFAAVTIGEGGGCLVGLGAGGVVTINGESYMNMSDEATNITVSDEPVTPSDGVRSVCVHSIDEITSEGMLTISETCDETFIVLTGDADGAALKGKRVMLTAGGQDNVSHSTVVFKDKDGATLGTVSNVTSGGGASPTITFDGNDTMKAVVPAGFTVGNMTVKTGNAAIKLAASAEDCELIEGNVELAAGKTAVIDGVRYRNTSDTAQIVTKASGGSAVLPENGSVKQVVEVSLAGIRSGVYVRHTDGTTAWVEVDDGTDRIIAQYVNALLTIRDVPDNWAVDILTGDKYGEVLTNMKVALAGGVSGVTLTFRNNAGNTLGTIGNVASYWGPTDDQHEGIITFTGLTMDEASLMTAKAEIFPGCTVGNMTVAENNAYFLLADPPEDSIVTATSGMIRVDSGKTFRVKDYICTNSGTAAATYTVEDGKVQIGKDVSVTVNDVKVTNTAAAALTVDVENENAVVTIAVGGSATIDDVTYTNAAQVDATIKKAKDGTAELTYGAVTLAPGASIITSIGTITNNDTAENEIFVQPAGEVSWGDGQLPNYTVALKNGSAMEDGNQAVLYIGHDGATIAVTQADAESPVVRTLTAGKVELEKDVDIVTDIGTITNHSEAHISVAKSGEISPGDNAEYAVALIVNGVLEVGTGDFKDTYTDAGDGDAEITVTKVGNRYTATLTGGSVKLGQGAVIVVNGVTVTNTADEVLTVDATSTNAVVTIAKGGSATIGGKTYTNTSTTATATILMEEGQTAKLTEGSVALGEGAAVVAGGSTANIISNIGENTITVVSNGNVTAIAENGVAEVVIAQRSATMICGIYYKNDGPNTETATIRSVGTDGKKVELVEGTVKTVAGAAIVLGDAVITGTGSDTQSEKKHFTVDATNGLTAVEEDGGCSIDLGTTKGTAVKIDGKTYTNAEDAQATITVDKDLKATLNKGSVYLEKDETIIYNKITSCLRKITNNETAGLTVKAYSYSSVETVPNQAVNYTEEMLTEGDSINIGGYYDDDTYTQYHYKNKKNAVFTFSRAADETGLKCVFTSGTITVDVDEDSNRKTLAGGNIIENVSETKTEAAITVNAAGDITEIEKNGVARVTIPAAGDITIGAATTYQNKDAAAQAIIETVGTDGTKVKLLEGTVSVSAENVEIVLDNAVIKNGNGKLVVDSANGVTIAAGASVTIDGVTYTNASTTDTATITKKGDGTVELTEGSVSFTKSGASLIANGVTVTNPADAQMTVAASGTNAVVTIDEGGSVTIDGVTYTATSDSTATITKTAGETAVLTEGKVTFGKGASITAGGNTITNTATEDTDNTITVDADGNVTAVENPYGVAKVEISKGGTAAICGNVYTNEGETTATIVTTNLEYPTQKLTEGVVSFSQAVAAILWGEQDVKVTNNVEGKKVFVSAADGVKGLDEGGRCTVNLGKTAGNVIKINGVEYKNAADALATIAVDSPLKATLVAGSVVLGKDAEIVTDIGSVQNCAESPITVSKDGNVTTNPADLAEYMITLKDGVEVAINGKAYTNSGSAVIDVKSAAGVEALTLTAGSVTLHGGAAIVTQSDDIGTITNNSNQAAYMITVNSDGTITDEGTDADYTVEIRKGRTATLGGKTYTTPSDQTAEIHVVKSSTGGTHYTTTLTKGAVVLGKAGSVQIGEVEYKAAEDQTKISVNSEQKAALETGAVELATGAAIVAQGVTVKNTSDTALKVAASGTKAVVTVAGGKSVTIDGETYRNMSTSEKTITKTKGADPVLPTDGSIKAVTEVSIDEMVAGYSYVLHTGGTKAWVSSLDAGDKVLAEYNNNTLTINAADQGAVAVLTGDDDGTALKGLKVAPGKNGSVDVIGVTMEFRSDTGVLLGTIGNVSSTQPIYFEGGESIVPMTVTIYAGCTAGNMTATNASTVWLAALAENCKLISGTVKLAAGKSAVVGVKTYTAASDSTAILKKTAANETAELTGGKVTFSSSGAAIVAKGVTVTKGSDGKLTVDATGESAVVTNDSKGSYIVTIGAGKAVTMDGETFKNTSETAANITKQYGQTAVLESGSGSVCVEFGKDVSVSANGNIISNEAGSAQDNTVTVNGNGEVTAIAKNGVAKVVIGAQGTEIVGTRYMKDGSSAATIQSVGTDGTKVKLVEGTVSTMAAAAIVLGGAVITNNNGGILVVDSTNGVTTANGGCSIDLGTTKGTAVKIDGVEYRTAQNLTAIINVDSALKATLTVGTVEFGKDAAIVAKGVTVTNTADANLTVAATDTDAVVTVAKGGSAEIAGVTYTNAGTGAMKITKAKDENAALTSGGPVALGQGALIVVNGVAVTNTSDAALTVAAKDTNAVVTVAAGKYVLIDGGIYMNTSSSAATITAKVGSVTLPDGVVPVAEVSLVNMQVGYKYVLHANGKKDWVSAAGTGDTVVAEYDGTTLTIHAANRGAVDILTGDDGGSVLRGKKVALAGTVSGVTLTFRNSAGVLGTIGNVASGTEISFDGQVSMKAVIPAGCTVGDMTVKAGGATIQLAAAAAFCNLIAGTVELAKGKSAQVGGTYFTAASDSTATITKADGQNPVLTAGKVTFSQLNASIVANGVTVTNDTQYKTLTVDAAGTNCSVTIAAGGSAKIGGVAYWNTGATNLTVTATDTNAVVTVAAGGSVKIGARTYTNTGTGAMTITQAKDGKAVLTSGGPVTLGQNTTIYANGVAVTNSSEAAVNVAASGTNAVVTVAKDGSVTIDSRTYTNASDSTATITKAADGIPVVKDGSVTVDVSNFTIQAGDVEITTVSSNVTVACFNGHGALRDGTVTLSSPDGKTATLYSAKTRSFAAGETASVTVAGTATVTAENSVIKSIKGLDANGEIFTVTKYEGNPAAAKVYTYAVDSVISVDNVVWKKTDPSGKIFYVDHMKADSDVLGSDGADWVEAVTVDKAFRWEQGVFVFTRANGVKITDGRNPKDVESGVTYIEATVGAGGALALAAKNGTPLHGLMDNDGADKTFNVDAAGAGKIVYAKDSGLKATVVFTNVAKDSEISGLGANDTIATATLRVGDKVVVDGVSYTAAAAGMLRFKGDALASGTVMADAAEAKPLKLLDGSTVYTTAAGTSARLTVASDGTIASVTGLAAGNTVVVEKGGVTTTYEAVTDTTVRKTVLGYTGSDKEKNGVFLTTLAKAGDDVVTGGAGTDAYARVLNLVYGTDGKISFADIWNSSARGSDGAGGGTHIYYYKVTSSFDETTGVTTCTIGNRASSGVNTSADNYFKAVYTDATGSIVLTYHQGTAAPISAVDLLGARVPISVDGSTVATTGAITKKLTLTETIPCMVTDLPATVKTVVNGDIPDADYKYKDTYEITTPIALGTGNAAWYRVNVVTAGSKANYGVNTCTLTQTTSEPTGAENYFSVTKTVGGYTVNYVPATVGNAFDLGGTTVTVNASGAPQDKTFVLMLTDSPRPAAYHVTGAPAGMTLSGVGAQDTISYTSTFTWPTTAGVYTYFTPATDASGNPVTELLASYTATTIVAPEADAARQKTYNKVKVTVGGDAGAANWYAIAVTGVKQTATGVNLTAAGTSLRTITVPSGYTNIDVSELPAGMTLAGVDNGDKVRVKVWNSLTVSGTGSFTVTDDGSNSASFTADSGTVSVKGGECVDGVFTLKAGDSALRGSNSSPVSGDYIMATLSNGANTTDAGTASTSAGDGKVSVTFRDGVIASITGLDAGETLMVSQQTASGRVAYSYTYDAAKGMVTRSDGLVAGADSTGVNVLSLDYGVYTDPLKTNGFAWATGDYYVFYNGSTANLTPTTSSRDVTTGSYIHAHYDSSSNVLTLEPVTGTKKGMVNPDESFAGTINVAASKDAPIKYTKSDSDSFKVSFTNVGKGSVFTNLNGSDKVTASLGKGESVTVNGGVYTAAADTTMTFEGGSAKTGTFLLDGAAPSITASTTDSSGNVTVVIIVFDKNTYTGDTANRNIAVTLSNGRLTAVTGLDASPDKTGEKVTVTTTVIGKNGTENTSTAVYTAALSTETGKVGQIAVTREQDGTKMVHTFSNSSQNILDSNAVWTTDDYVTRLDFDWDTSTTGYFAAALSETGKYTATIAEQAYNPKDPTTWIDKDDAGSIFLKITAKKTDSGMTEIKSIGLVKVEPNGALAAFSGSVGTIGIDASGAGTDGFKLPSHSNAFVVTGAQDGAAYSGLNASDTLKGVGTVTMNNVQYVASGAYEMTGSGTITEGVFKVAASATGSAKALHNGDNEGGAVTNRIVYTAGEEFTDGVSVKFAGGKIVSVADLEPGEKVTLTRAKGTAQTAGLTTTITKDVDNIVTRSAALAGATLVMTRIDNNPETDVLSADGYKVSNKFDFGATTEGRLGLFAVNAGTASVSAQKDTETLVSGRSYLLVDASKSSTSVTINALEVFTDNAGSLEKAKGNTVLANGITLAAPEGCSLTLASSAAKLYTTYKLNDAGTAWVKDETENTETSRTYGINVTGAAKGMSYSGFGETDTITGALVSGDSITVNGKLLTLAGSAAISVRGDGRIINGVYTLGGGVESAANVNAAENDRFTANVTGASASSAAVRFENGKVTSITGLTAKNQTVTIAETNAKTGAVRTTTYKVTDVDAATGEMTVTRTITDDGRTANATAAIVSGADVTADYLYGDETGTLASRFTWNPKDGSGYFLTKASDTSKELGEVTVTTGSTTAKAGSYYLRAGYNMTKEQWEFSLHKINADGTPGSNILSSATGGTIKVAAPSSAVKLDLSTGVPSSVAMNVTGVAAGSEITMANGNASMTTANLPAGQSLTVNGRKLTAAVSGVMEFEGAGGLKNGVVRFDKETADGDLTVMTSKGSLAVSAPTTETEKPTVTVKNGVVTTIEGNETTTVTVKDGSGRNQAVYAAKLAGVAFSSLTNGAEIETAALAEGATVQIGGSVQTYTLTKAGVIKATVSGGALRFREANLSFAVSSGTLYTTGAKATDTSDDRRFSFTRNSGASTATVEIRNGEITAVKGLRENDVFEYDGATYTAKTSTAIEKVYTDGQGKTQKVIAYISAGADILSASYAAVGDDVTGMYEGQFSWSDLSGRSTGYFKVDGTKKTAYVSEQPSKTSPTAAKNTAVTYVVANASAAEEGGVTPQVLTIDAIQLESDGVITTLASDDAKTLLAGVKITVTAPTAAVNGVIPAISYTKTVDDIFIIIINKAAANSVFTGLTEGDKASTATLAIGESVTAGGLAYAAGAKGTLDFLGEGDASSSRTTLVRGTILLDSGNRKAILSGSADGAEADIEVSLDDSKAVDENGVSLTGSAKDQVILSAVKGVVTSVTGLETKGMALTIGTVTYKVLNAGYTLDSKGKPTTTKTVTIERIENGKSAYGSFTLGKTFLEKFDKNGNLTNYTAAVDTPTNLDILWTDTDTKTEKNGRVIYAAVDEENETATFAKANTAETIDGSKAERGKRYLAMTVTTAKGVTTIKKIEAAEIGATGKPEVVKNLTVAAAGLRAVIDGKNGSGFATINYAIPSTVPVTITNAAVGSAITGIKQNNGKTAGDLIASADEKGRALTKGAVSLYRIADADIDADGKADVKRTVETKVTYATSAAGDSATIDAVSGAVTKLTGLDKNGEKVTVAETTEKGARTTIYEVKTVNGVKYVYKTVTEFDGAKKVYRSTTIDPTHDWIADKSMELVSTDVVSEFDWTMEKKSTGYFAVSTKNGAVSAALKAQTNAVAIAGTDTKTYIAVKISGDGVVESVKSVTMDWGEMVDAKAKFAGTLNVTAPTKVALDFDRSKLDAATMDAESVHIAVTGALAGSRLTELALGDTVVTKKLNKTETVTLGVAGDGNGAQVFAAGTSGALSFAVQTVDGSAKLSLTGGTVKLTAGDYVYAGDRMITMAKGSATVVATTGVNGTAYTVGDLKEGETFTVETFGDGACTRKYTRSANNLFCEIVKNGSTTVAVYEIKSTTSVTGKILEQAGDASAKSSKWTTCTESNAAFRTTDDGLKLVSTVKNAAVTVDLSLLDKRIASDNKLYKSDPDYVENQGDADAYSFIIDKYMADPKKFAGAAAVVADGNLLELQQVIGTRVGGTKKYSAEGVDIAQTIKATKEWHVVGSDRDDTITGASSGADTLEGGAGNDLLTGGGASDTFIVGAGKDTIKSFATNKDSVSWLGGDLNVSLAGTDVLIWSDDDHDGVYGAGDSSALIVGMGNRKAISIDGVNYYVGSEKAKKAETFSFDAGSAEQAAKSRYYGKAGLANTLAIGTSKAMASRNTLGDTVTVDLSDTARYSNISIADASKSGNRVDLKAAASGSTLKGGTYQSTLRGGAGADSLVGGSGTDVFWFDAVEKDDVVTGYTSGKDSVCFGNVTKATAAEIDGMTIEAVGNDVVIRNGSDGSVKLQKAVSATKAVTILADERGMNKLSYYVGKAGSLDKKGNPTGKNEFKATLGKDAVVKDSQDVSLTSYYVGSDSSVDTLKIVGTDKKNKLTAKVSLADLADHLSSIDVLDASGMTTVKDSEISIQGKAAGTFTLIGSSNKNVKETFDLKTVKTTDATSVTVKGLDLADVIEIAAGVTATLDDTKSTKTNTYFKLTDSTDSKKVYGEILVSGVGKGNFGTTYSGGTIQRTK